jgi:hypothetical protein
MMTTRSAARVGAAIMILVLATSCSVGGQPQAAPVPVSPVAVTHTVTTTALATTTILETTTVEVSSVEPVFAPPTGFDDWGDHVGARWSDQTTFSCADSAESCWGVDLYSELGCAGGILVVLDVSRDETKLIVLDGKTDPVTAGATVNLILGQTGNGTGLTAKIADIRCLAG